MNIPIIKLRHIWFMLSSVLVALSIVCLVVFPLRLGLDFTGGSMLEVVFKNARPAPTAIVEALSKLDLGEIVTQTSGDSEMFIRMKEISEAKHQEVVAALNEKFGGIDERRFENIGPTVGAELKKAAAVSVSLVLLGIALYIAYAFRKVSRPVASWKYGLVTLVVGLGHDVLIPLGAMALAGHFMGAEVSSSFIAALLTVLSFTVHDTIVVFDRIRENLLKTSGTFDEILTRSVNETLARSINTSLATVLPLLAIWFIGGESLHWFAFTLIVGIISGAYSSIFLCSPLLLVLQGKKKGRR
jgi:preprotein translocase subunit SecF